MTDAPAYYVAVGGVRYRPTDATTSPWDDAAQHGGPPSALLASVMAAALAAPALRMARITVEFLGPIPRRELTVSARVARPGRRVAMTEATLTVDDRTAALARAWFIVTGPPPPPQTRRPAVEIPPLPAEQPQKYFPGLTRWGYGESIEWRFARGGLDAAGPAAVWTRARIPLIAGTELTGLQHALVVADAANGVSTVLPLEQWWFIPTGITVNIVRYPADAWVLLDAVTDVGTDGIGLTTATLADRSGVVGQVSQPLLIAQR